MAAGGWRGFPLFWSGRAASQFGDEITLLALPWLVATETASPLSVGLLEAVSFAPALLLGLPIGALADRRSRRRSMIEADCVRLLLLMTLPVVVGLGLGASLAQVLAIAFLVGIGHTMFEAAAQAFLTDLVPRDALLGANARLSFTEGLAVVLGPATAGLLIATLGAVGALTVDAATFALSAVALLTVHRVSERYAPATPMGAAIREGLQVILGNRKLRALTVLAAAGNAGAAGVVGLAVIFLQGTLELDGWQAGIVFAANGAGGVAASLASPRLAGRIGIGRTVLVGWAGAAIGFVAFSAATSETWFLAATGGEALIGLGVVTSIIAGATFRQHLVPVELLGRVTTCYRTVANGAVVVGALAGGIIGEAFGIRTALFLGAGTYVLVSLAGFLSPLNGPDAAEPASAD